MSESDIPDAPTPSEPADDAPGTDDALILAPEKAAALCLTPLARLVTWAGAGVEPERIGIGPVPASELALRRAGLALKDLDLIELNEAFAAQVLACTAALNFQPGDFERLNVNGSGISLGHPVGATGGRILATMLREMDHHLGRLSALAAAA